MNILKHKGRSSGAEERQLTFDARMDHIMKVADRNMDQAKCGQKLAIRDTVVITYADLLTIWNMAETAKSNTLVG